MNRGPDLEDVQRAFEENLRRARGDKAARKVPDDAERTRRAEALRALGYDPETLPDRLITAAPYAWREPKSIPRRAWLYGMHYLRGCVGATIAAGGGGKSSLFVVEQLAMVSGKPLLGGRERKPLTNWYVGLEDDADEFARRVQRRASITACRNCPTSVGG